MQVTDVHTDSKRKSGPDWLYCGKTGFAVSNMTDENTSTKLWGGRFTESTDAFVEAFTASIDFDQRLYRYDIAGSTAHASMLAHVGIITADECNTITSGLEDILAEIERGDFAWSVELEDIHMNIEARLIERIGETGKKLHTGRSRNDQVATDLRLYLRDEIDKLCRALIRLRTALVDIADARPTPSCPALRICRSPCQSVSDTTCWPGKQCWNAIISAFSIAANGSM